MQFDNDDGDPIEPEELGTSSALHEIRDIAAGYRKHLAAEQPEEAKLGDFTMQSALLLPSEPTGSDKWKLGALTLITVLGASTAVLAVKFYNDSALPPSRTFKAKPSVEIHTQPEPPRLPALKTPALPDPAPYTAPTPQPSSRHSAKPHELATPPVGPVHKAVPATRMKRSIATQSCDEVACLLDASDCCPDQAPLSLISEARQPVRPYRFTRQQVLGPMRAISGRVRSCFDQHDFKDVATVKLTITPSGRVDGFSLADGDGAFQSCVERLVTPLQFDELKQPFTLSYPFTYR